MFSRVCGSAAALMAGLAFLLSQGTPPVAQAQWSEDPNLNTPVAVEALSQSNSVAASDGAGGMIVTWMDDRNVLTQTDIYAQRLDANGVARWGANGIAICVAGGIQANPAIVSDGLGGAIITWEDFRGGTYDIYARRVSAAGEPLWTDGGVLIGAAANDQRWPMLVGDGANGAIITWEDNRAGGLNYDIYAQRVSGAGETQWSPLVGGVPICVQPNWQAMPMIVRAGLGGTGGAIITWYDARTDAGDIYAQRISLGGVVQWAPNGNIIAAAANQQTQPTIAVDNAGGAIITWYDYRNGIANPDIFAQRVDVDGVALWPLDGIAVCVDASELQPQEYPKIAADGAGGAFITWQDFRGGNWNIYGQHLDVNGVVLFPFIPNGWLVCGADGDQTYPKIVGDGSGGAIIAWVDARDGLQDIYAQRYDAGGIPQWLAGTPFGVALCTQPADQNWQFQFSPLVADGNRGALVTWNDWRGGAGLATPPQIYAQNVNGDGSLGPRPLAFWRFEGGVGPTISDASGNGHTGSIIGASTLTMATPDGMVGGRPNSWSLNVAWNPSPPPAIDAVVVPDSPTLRPASGITVEAWVRPTDGTTGPIISKQMFQGPPAPPIDTYSYQLYARDSFSPTGGVSFTLANTSGVETKIVGLTRSIPAAVPPSNRWSHVAGTWDAGSGIMRLYVDFVEVASAPFAGPIGYVVGSPVLIGGANVGAPGSGSMNGFAGDIDEVRIFDRALTPAEMLHSASPLAPIVISNNPVPFESIAGGSSYDLGWTAIDDGGVSSVTIEFTSNFGATYTTLAAGEPNDSVYTWTVPGIISSLCRIRITAFDGTGASASDESPGIFAIGTPVGVGGDVAPARLAVAASPNPFNPHTTLRFDLPTAGNARLAVYDVAGRLVNVLVDSELPAGSHQAVWDGRDSAGRGMASGSYFARLTAGGKIETVRMGLVR